MKEGLFLQVEEEGKNREKGEEVWGQHQRVILREETATEGSG